MYLIPILLALGAAFFWTFGEVLGKLVLVELNTTTYNMIGFSIAAIALAPLALIVGLGPVTELGAVHAVVYGVFGLFVVFQVYFYTMRRAHAHIVASIGNSAPIWTLLFAPTLLGEKLTILLIISLSLVVIGSTLFIKRETGSNKWKWAVPLSLSVAVLWGFNMVIQKSAVNLGMKPLTFMLISAATAALLFNLSGVVTRSWHGSRFTGKNLRVCAVSIISSRFLGGILYLSALGLEDISALAPFISATVPFAFLLSVLLVREKPTKKALVGAILIFLGLIIASF